MPVAAWQKPGSLKDPSVAQLFSTKDPELRYYDLREVGSGSFGNVYFAQDRESNETVAIKKMNFNGKDASEKWNDISRMLLQNVRHPNIVEYKACFLKGQTCWMVMEYCLGSASDIISVFKDQLVEGAIAEICDQTLSALIYIHSLNFIHRDVKAGNILITDAGVVKLGDLGSAALRAPANSFVGSPFWIAPEVVLAMDDGQYDTKVDIWSLGITCIELANRKPPLYDLNTMSALYHIAQNDPPSLSRVHPVFENIVRSDEIISFVQHCLSRDPAKRPSAQECKGHPFLRHKRRENIMLNLVRHTKRRVRKLDNDMYAKMKKLFYLDGVQGQGNLSSSSSEDEDECFISQDGGRRRKSISNGTNNNLEMGKENGKNGRSINSTSSDNDLTLVADDQRPNKDSRKDTDTLDVIPDELLRTESIHSNSSTLPKNRTVISISENEDDSESTGVPSSELIATSSQLPSANINDEIATLKKSKYETLRTTRIISREIEESRRENNAKEQMRGYQQLRQRHQRELQSLEERCKFEADALRQKQEKDYEQYVLNAQREIHKLRSLNQAQLERKARENDDVVKKLRKQLLSSNEHELKSFIVCQKKEYKFNKEQAKKQFKDRGLRKSSFEEAMKRAKSDLMLKWSTAEGRYIAEQRERMQTEIIQLKQRSQSELQCLEQRLLSNEHSVRRKQLETIEQILMGHHNAAKEQVLNHFNECAGMKKRHLRVQHESELNNQTDYTRRAQDELKKQHALKQKNLPRELKLKEAHIKKQFRHAVKVQSRQFKIFQAQLMQTVSKEEQKEVNMKLKEDQTRKIASLGVQYDNTIKKMISEQTIQMDSSQEEEIRQLNEKLNRELNLLLEFQTRQKDNLDVSCIRELESLETTWTTKKTVLQKMIEDDRLKFESERVKQLDTLQMQQEKERLRLEALDPSFIDPDNRFGHSVPSTPMYSSIHSRIAERYNSDSPTTSSRSSPSQSTNL